MEKTLLCVLLTTKWAFAFEVSSLSVNLKAASLPKQTSMFPRSDGPMPESPGSAFPTINLSVSNLAKRVKKLEKDMEDEKNVQRNNQNKEVRLDYVETALEKLLHDNENKDLRLGHMEAVLANLTSELSVHCGSPTPLEGTDVVYGSTGLLANYKCKRGLVNIHPGQQTVSLCQKDGKWTMVNVKCINLSPCSVPAGRMLYTGTRSTTITGKACQRWDSQMPQNHEFNVDVMFWIPGFDTPQTVTGSANYCRDPSRSGYLWCYTTDPNTRWEKCNIPLCNVMD